jgi:hypothetical protein
MYFVFTYACAPRVFETSGTVRCFAECAGKLVSGSDDGTVKVISTYMHTGYRLDVISSIFTLQSCLLYTVHLYCYYTLCKTVLFTVHCAVCTGHALIRRL